MVDRYIPEKLIECPICHKPGFKNLAFHIRSHGLTVEEMRKQYAYTGLIITQSQSRLMAARSNALWADPIVRQKRIDGIVASYDDDLRERRSSDAKISWTVRDRIKHAARMSEVSKNAQSNPSPEMIASWDKKLSPIGRLRKDLRSRANNSCEECGVTEKEYMEKGGRRLHLHHLHYDRLVPELDDVVLLCATCHHKLHGDGHSRERMPMVTKAVGLLLNALRVDLDDENFAETPRRLATYLLEHFVSAEEFDESLEEFGSAVFPSEYSGMIVQQITATGLCPHHLLPVAYEGVVGYIPDELTIGLSKLMRATRLCLRTPVLQEFGTLFVADTLSDLLKTPHVAVVLRGRHSCMSVRGVQSHDSLFTQTSELRGAFRDEVAARAEFMQFVAMAENRSTSI